MKTSEKQISLAITKIYNWPQVQANASFDLIFYSDRSSSPIIEKSVAGVYTANSMEINAYLKIIYTEEEKTVVMKMVKRGKQEVLGEFQIDLDALKQKKVQYFPFGKDNVLQINLYVPQSSKKSVNSKANLENKKFIKEKKQHLQNQILEQKAADRLFEPRIKKSFSEKVLSLLHEVKTLKDNIGVQTNYRQKTSSNSKRPTTEEANNYRMKKSMSDYKLRTASMMRSDNKSEWDVNSGNNKPLQRHRLILDSLNVVPYNEYYIDKRSESNNQRNKIS